MAHFDGGYATKSGAARLLRISRRTVQRYCDYQSLYKLDPPLIDSRGRVHIASLSAIIGHRKKLDSRGFPLGKKRYTRQPALIKIQKTVGRSFKRRLEIIQAEIDAMSDGEQTTLLLRWSREVFSRMFRPIAYERAKKNAPDYTDAAKRVGREADYVSGWSWLD